MLAFLLFMDDNSFYLETGRFILDKLICFEKSSFKGDKNRPRKQVRNGLI